MWRWPAALATTLSVGPGQSASRRRNTRLWRRRRPATASGEARQNQATSHLTTAEQHPGQHHSPPHTHTHSTNSIALRQCVPGIEYESLAPTSTSNRECTRISPPCDRTFEAAAPTATSDRVCVPCESGTSLVGGVCVPCSVGTYTPKGSVGNCSNFECSVCVWDGGGGVMCRMQNQPPPPYPPSPDTSRPVRRRRAEPVLQD